MLSIDTPIPTPNGWSRIEDLQPGDEVYGERGQVERVTARYATETVPTFRVHLDDGTWVDACADHQWWTVDKVSEKRFRRSGSDDIWDFAKVRTTKEIWESVRYGQESNHRIPLAGPLAGPQWTGIDPYYLGCWLGDGISNTGALCLNRREAAEILDRIPYEMTSVTANYAYGSDRQSQAAIVYLRGVAGLLASVYQDSIRTPMCSLERKRIPQMLLRADEESRRALLAGLLDTDGSCSRAGVVEYCTVSEGLAHDVYELVRSLGIKVSMRCNDSWQYRNGSKFKAGRPRWRLNLRPDYEVFGLAHKNANLKLGLGQRSRSRSVFITEVEQLPPQPMCCISVTGDRRAYLAGKQMVVTHNTRTGSEWLAEGMTANPGTYWAAVATTFDDGRDTMIEGESGLEFVLDRRKIRHTWNRSLGQLILDNNARLDMFSSQKPESLRGPNLSGVWGDEPATWIYPVNTWDNLLLMCRKGEPKIVLTGTPQPSAFVKKLITEADLVTTGSSYDNRDNLSDTWFEKVVTPLEGTRRGRQEIYGELLEDVEGTLWVPSQLDATRKPAPKRFERILVAVDPSVSAKARDECGIMVGGIAKDHGYLLGDFSVQAPPERWAQRVADVYADFEADAVVGEINNGGDLVRVNIHAKDPSIRFQEVTASRGKTTRAEPVSALYGDPTSPETWPSARLHHVEGIDFVKLEDQMTTWVQGDRNSPDRMDAMVWLFTKMMGLESKRRRGRGGLRYRK